MTIEFEKDPHEMIVEGHRVWVRLDLKGKPISVSAAWPPGGDQQRIARLAMDKARQVFARRAKSKSDVVRTKRSTEKKQMIAAEHWSNEWLAAAHRANPKFGRGRLAQAARTMLVRNKPETPPEKRDEITKDRARQFLETQREK